MRRNIGVGKGENILEQIKTRCLANLDRRSTNRWPKGGGTVNNPCDYKPQVQSDFIGKARFYAGLLDKAVQMSPEGPLKFLFVGKPGTGKTELGHYMQRKLGVTKWSLHKYNGSQCKIEAVDKLAEQLAYTDYFSPWRMVWIEEADAIPSVSAQIRLLTVIDETPKKVVWVLTSNCAVKDFETRFQSRFQVLEFPPVPQADIEAFLKRWPLRENILKQIATFACGNVRQALLDAQTQLCIP